METRTEAIEDKVMIEFIDEDGESVNVTLTVDDASYFFLKLAYSIDKAKNYQISNYNQTLNYTSQDEIGKE